MNAHTLLVLIVAGAAVLGFLLGTWRMGADVVRARQDGWDRGNEAMRRQILRYIDEVAKSPKQYLMLTDHDTEFAPDCNLVLMGDGIVVNGLDAHKHEVLIPDFAHRCNVVTACDPVRRRKWREQHGYMKEDA